MSKELIRLTNLTMTFEDGETILDNINLYINNKEFLTLLGPSGCGKTTMLRIIGGFLSPTSGDVLFNGQRINDVPAYKRKINTVFQRYALFPHLDVYDNIAFGLRIARVPESEIDDRVTEMLEIVSLKGFENRRVTSLSGGQQQRVAFARAIVIEPACILFDEPLSALDALLREEMRSELRTLITKLGITGVFVTHDQIEAMSMSDAIAVCHAGKVEQYDTPEKIYSHPATEFVARFVGSSNWIDQNHLFRPEQAQTVPTEQAEKYDADVTAVQFLGSSYQLQLNHNGRDWTYISPRRVSVGEKLSLYLPRSAIVAV